MEQRFFYAQLDRGLCVGCLDTSKEIMDDHDMISIPVYDLDYYMLRLYDGNNWGEKAPEGYYYQWDETSNSWIAVLIPPVE